MILLLFKNIYKINKIFMQTNSEQTNEISLRQPEQDISDDVSPFDIFNNPQIKRNQKNLYLLHFVNNMNKWENLYGLRWKVQKHLLVNQLETM